MLWSPLQEGVRGRGVTLAHVGWAVARHVITVLVTPLVRGARSWDSVAGPRWTRRWWRRTRWCRGGWGWTRARRWAWSNRVRREWVWNRSVAAGRAGERRGANGLSHQLGRGKAGRILVFVHLPKEGGLSGLNILRGNRRKSVGRERQLVIKVFVNVRICRSGTVRPPAHPTNTQQRLHAGRPISKPTLAGILAVAYVDM